jgi:hypothetical protein
VAFDTKVPRKIGFETLKAKKGLGLHHVLVRKGNILHLNDPHRFVWVSSLKHMSVKRKKYDKDCSSGDICFPHVKGVCEEGSPNRKTDFLQMKDSGIYVDPPWEKCS